MRKVKELIIELGGQRRALHKRLTKLRRRIRADLPVTEYEKLMSERAAILRKLEVVQYQLNQLRYGNPTHGEEESPFPFKGNLLKTNPNK